MNDRNCMAASVAGTQGAPEPSVEEWAFARNLAQTYGLAGFERNIALEVHHFAARKVAEAVAAHDQSSDAHDS